MAQAGEGKSAPGGTGFMRASHEWAEKAGGKGGTRRLFEFQRPVFIRVAGPLKLRCCYCVDDVHTFAHSVPMTRDVSSASDRLGGVSSASAGAKGSISLRIDPRVRQLIDEAAAILGTTRTEFMIESARKVAVDILLDQRLFMLNPELYAGFVQLLDNPPAPGPKLRALMQRMPAWEK